MGKAMGMGMMAALALAAAWQAGAVQLPGAGQDGKAPAAAVAQGPAPRKAAKGAPAGAWALDMEGAGHKMARMDRPFRSKKECLDLGRKLAEDVRKSLGEVRVWGCEARGPK